MPSFDDPSFRPETATRPDPIGTASARLLAAGVDRVERTDALAFLGLLLDHADATGWVRIPIDVLAAEFAIGAADAAYRVTHLHRVGAVEPVDGGWRVLDHDGYHSVGLRAADAMALIAEALGRPVAVDVGPSDEVELAPLVPVPRSPVLTVPVLPDPKPRPSSETLLVLLGVLAAIALLGGLVLVSRPW